MKKTFKIILFLLLAVPVLFIGCKKTEVTDGSNPNPKVEKALLAYCGTPVVKNLYEFGSNTKIYGNVTVGNDLYNLYVTIKLTDGVFWNDGFQWYEQGCHLFAGTAEEMTALNAANVAKQDANKTGYFAMYSFKYHADLSAIGKQTYQFTIPRSSISVNCPMIVVGASIKTGAGTLKLVSAKQELKHAAYWFNYCMQACGSGCETAYAKSQSNPVDSCFLTIPGITSNNWGWTNRIITAGTYDWPIYAGAGQCDITKGTLVGNLHVVYALPVPPATTRTATITFNMGGNVHLYTTHLYVGNLILPKKNNKWTTAPGQFPYKHENLNGVNSDSYSITGLSGTIYIAAHADVCW